MPGKSLSKMVPQKHCKNCNTLFSPSYRTVQKCDLCKSKLFCSLCGEETNKNYFRGAIHCQKCAINKTHEKYNETNKDEWVECTICGFRAKEIGLHIRNEHGLSSKEYGCTKSKNMRDRVSGDKNPAHNHGGRFSPWSKNFIYGYDEQRHSEFKSSQSELMKNCKNNVFRRSFYNSEEEYSKAQTRDLNWFISKYGEEEGKIRHAAKIEKWMKNNKKLNFSKISQELFTAIDEIYEGNIFYATKDRPEMANRVNKEYKLNEIRVSLDFVDIDKKKVIEFDGDYWHGSRGNIEREKLRDQKIMSLGFEILHIKEKDFKENRKETIEKCILFLTR